MDVHLEDREVFVALNDGDAQDADRGKDKLDGKVRHVIVVTKGGDVVMVAHDEVLGRRVVAKAVGNFIGKGIAVVTGVQENSVQGHDKRRLSRQVGECKECQLRCRPAESCGEDVGLGLHRAEEEEGECLLKVVHDSVGLRGWTGV